MLPVLTTSPTRAMLNRIVATWCTLRNWYAIPECLSSVRHEVPKHVKVQIYHWNRIRHVRAAQARTLSICTEQDHCRTCKYVHVHAHTVIHTHIHTYIYTHTLHSIYQKYDYDTPLSCSLKKMPTTTASSWTRRLEQENIVHLDVHKKWCKLIDELNQCLFRKFFRYCKDRKTRSTSPKRRPFSFASLIVSCTHSL